MMASIKYFISHDIKNRFKNAVTLLTSNVTVMMGQGLQGQKEMYIYIQWASPTHSGCILEEGCNGNKISSGLPVAILHMTSGTLLCRLTIVYA